jgi:23S rRNA pseudouridine955/2504/2580 synthase
MDARSPSGEQVFTVREDDAGRRLDRVLRKLLPRATLATIYAGLRKGEALVGQAIRGPSYRLSAGEVLRLGGALANTLAPTPPPPPVVGAPPPNVLHRAAHFVVFDKPRGLAVHGNDSLCSRARALLESLAGPSLSFHPGPVHRLDKDTSGIVFFALTLTGARELSALLRDRACKKTYLALVEGILAGPAEWRDNLRYDAALGRAVRSADGDLAVSSADPLAHGSGLTLARVRIETGRRHQIRAQAMLHGHPLAGDVRYGGRPEPDGYVLHAARFQLPANTELSSQTLFAAPLPDLSRRTLERYLGSELVDIALATLAEPAASP